MPDAPIDEVTILKALIATVEQLQIAERRRRERAAFAKLLELEGDEK